MAREAAAMLKLARSTVPFRNSVNLPAQRLTQFEVLVAPGYDCQFPRPPEARKGVFEARLCCFFEIEHKRVRSSRAGQRSISRSHQARPGEMGAWFTMFATRGDVRMIAPLAGPPAEGGGNRGWITYRRRSGTRLGRWVCGLGAARSPLRHLQ